MPYLIATLALFCGLFAVAMFTDPDHALQELAGILGSLGFVICVCSLGIIRAVDRLRKQMAGPEIEIVIPDGTQVTPVGRVPPTGTSARKLVDPSERR